MDLSVLADEPQFAPSPLEVGLSVIDEQIEALKRMKQYLVGSNFNDAVNMIYERTSKGGILIVTGVGKSGHIGRKFAATLSSTGTRCFFIHSTDAMHGDLGVLSNRDIMLCFSNSGSTKEVVDMLHSVRLIGANIITISGQSREECTLGKNSDVHIAYGTVNECDPNGLAPTCSTTVQTVLGDAIACALIRMKGFSAIQFGLYHPGGHLGAQVLGSVQARLVLRGQRHVLAFLSSLKLSEKEAFMQGLANINLEMIDILKNIHPLNRKVAHKNAVTNGTQNTVTSNQGAINDEEEKEEGDEKLTPFEDVISLANCTETDINRWRDIGLSKLAEGKIAIVALAGGIAAHQHHTPGLMDIGLPSHSTLFEIQARRLSVLQRLAYGHKKSSSSSSSSTTTTIPSTSSSSSGSSIPWYIMVDEVFERNIHSFFDQNIFFGLNSEDVHIFRQGKLPCLSMDEGLLILNAPDNVVTSPNGSGGLFQALKDSGCYDDMLDRGIEHVFTYAVDNPLVRLGDPVFLGFYLESKAQIGYKVVPNELNEPAGMLMRRGQANVYLEHQDLKAMGGLVRSEYSNMLNLFIDMELFSRGVTGQIELPYRAVPTTIPFLDSKGYHMPEEDNAYRYGRSVMDILAHAESIAALCVEREDEFAPIKFSWDTNSQFTPEDAIKHLSRLHKRMILQAGGSFDDSSSNNNNRSNNNNNNSSSSRSGGSFENDGICEISASLTYAGEGLEQVCKGRVFSLPLFLKDSTQ